MFKLQLPLVLTIGTFSQVLLGQENENQPLIIRTAPIELPCQACSRCNGRFIQSPTNALTSSHQIFPQLSIRDENCQSFLSSEDSCQPWVTSNQDDGVHTSVYGVPIVRRLPRIVDRLGKNAMCYEPYNYCECEQGCHNPVMVPAAVFGDTRGTESGFEIPAVPADRVSETHSSTSAVPSANPLDQLSNSGLSCRSTTIQKPEPVLSEAQILFGSCYCRARISDKTPLVDEDSLYTFKKSCDVDNQCPSATVTNQSYAGNPSTRFSESPCISLEEDQSTSFFDDCECQTLPADGNLLQKQICFDNNQYSALNCRDPPNVRLVDSECNCECC